MPSLAFEPIDATRPPMTTVGSLPPAPSTAAQIEEVEVLPWLPATAIPYLTRISSARSSPLDITGSLRRLASASSALFAGMAELVTTASGPFRFSAACPVQTSAPSLRSLAVIGESRRSEPVTV